MKFSLIIKVVVATISIPLILLTTCLAVVLIYCQGFVEHVPFIDDNNLNNRDEVFEFIAQDLPLQRASITNTQEFIAEHQIDCSGILDRIWTERFAEINYDSFISCTVRINQPSFLGYGNLIIGKLETCYYTPRLRIMFLFEDETLVHVFQEILLYGL